MDYNTYYYLSHGGQGSGRYPWGSGDRPYQRLEKSRGRSSISEYIRSRKQKKAEQKQIQTAEEERKMKMLQAERDRLHKENRDKVLRSGSAIEVMKYQGELTNKELQDAYNRIDLERKLSSFAQSDVKTGMEKIDKAMSNLKTINNWGSTLTDSYNLMASIYNATPEGKKDPWNLVKKEGGGGKKK